MAAFTEGYSNTVDYDKGPGHMGAAISKVLAARKFAREERELAEKKAKKAGYDGLEELGVEKGYFFKAALKSKFGGSYITGKKQDIKQAVDRVKLLKNPKAQFWNFVDNRDADGKEVKKKSAVDRFRDQFDNYGFVGVKKAPEVDPQAQKVPNTGEETAEAASGQKQRVTREDILSAVTAIATSLDKTAQSINNNVQQTKEVATGVQAIKTDVVSQLSERTDSIEDKLNKIALAINEQTALAKSETDKKEGAADITSTKGQFNVADNESAKDLTDEIDKPLKDKFELGEDMSVDPPPMSDDPEEDDIPRAETGGIISGPDSGYLAELHGDEMVVPLDNNYTQGEASAIDGKVRPVPNQVGAAPASPIINNNYNLSPKFEQGTPKKESSLGGKVGFTPMNIPSLGGKEVDHQVQLLQDAMKLVFMIPGGVALAATTQLAGSIDNAEASSQIAAVARPLAQAFGLPSTLVSKAKGGKVTSEGRSGAGDSGDGEKKGIFASLGSALKKMFSGGGGGNNGGGGGATTTVGGGGGNSSASQKEVAGVMGEEFENQGLSEEGAKLALAEIGRENSLSRSLILGTHDDGGVKAYGAVSWQGGREKALMDELKARGIDPSEAGLAGSGDEGLRANAAAMVKEIAARGHTELLDLLKKPNLTNAEKDKVRKLFKDQYFVYNKGISLQRSRDWYETVGAMSQQPTPPDTDPDDEESVTPIDSQKLKRNYGAKTHERIYFMHKGKRHNAYKTTNGFVLFLNKMEIDTSDGRNSDVVDSFVKTAEERLKPPSKKGDQASLSPAPKSTASLQGPSAADKAQTVAMINSPSAGQRKTATTGQQPTDQGTVEEGRDHSLNSFYNPSAVIG